MERAVDEDELEGGAEGPLEAAGLDFEYQGGGAAAVEAEQAGEVRVRLDHLGCCFFLCGMSVPFRSWGEF